MGHHPAYGSKTAPLALSATNVALPVSAIVSNLTHATTVRLVATNSAGTNASGDMAFAAWTPWTNALSFDGTDDAVTVSGLTPPTFP